MVRLHNVTKWFGDQPVFLNATISIPETGFVLLFGESGSGKTTFLNILSGQLSFEEGYIFYEGERYEKQVPAVFADQAEYLTQDAFFADFLSVADNLRLMGADEAAIENHLQLVGLADKAEAFPPTLSGGERQRLMLARTLLKGKKVLLLDEPTASLDKENKERIFELLKKLSETVLIIMASHDPLAGAYADHTVLFDKKTGEVEVRHASSECSQEGVSPTPTQTPVLSRKPASDFLKKWFRFSGRERFSAICFVLFMALAFLFCTLADTPEHKNQATMADLYRLNCLELRIQGNHEIEEVLPKDSRIKEKVISYNESTPWEKIPTGTGMFNRPSYETNLKVLPNNEALCKVKTGLAYGSYFTGPDQAILSYRMAERLSPFDPSSLLGKTIQKELYGRGIVSFTIVGIFNPFTDLERIYLRNCGSDMSFGSFYSPDTENDAFFVSASTLDSLIQDPAYYSESGGRQRVWYLYFDSFWRMYRFYQEHRSDLNRDLDDYGGRVMLRLQGIPLDYSMKWPMLSRVLLPLSALMVLLTVLFFVNMKRTELAYNNRFIAVFEYAGYGKKEVLRTLVRLSLLEFLAELGIAFGIALVLSLIGNAVNEGLHLLPLSLFSFNPWILGGAIAVIILLAWFYLKYSLSRIRAKSWYELLRETRDLL